MYEFDISRDPKLLCTTHILFLDYLFKADYLRWSRDSLPTGYNLTKKKLAIWKSPMDIGNREDRGSGSVLNLIGIHPLDPG